MTKFEEEFKTLTSWDWINVDLIQRILTKFGNWHSDEDYQELLKENNKLKFKLQQQALPVVPKDVDKAIKYLKKHNNSTLSDLDDILTAKGFSWLNDFQFKDRRFGVGGLNNKLFILSHLAITGYTVEKPQLFYLKNKLTGKYLRSYTGLSMDDTTLRYEDVKNKKACGFGGGTKFTQEEIDSMEAGSYEKIEVEE